MMLVEKPIEKSKLAEIAKERFGDLIKAVIDVEQGDMSSGFQHQTLSEGRWFSFTLAEQLGNIGSEVHRAIRARGDEARFDRTVNRTLELFDLTLGDSRWKNRLKEIARAREVFCDAVFGGKEYDSTLEALNDYFFYFALAARSKK